MIFKTFQSELDGISNKIGFSKRSFAEWGKQVSVSFKESEGVVNKFKNTLQTMFVMKSENSNNWIKNKMGDIISKDNIDSFIPELTKNSADKILDQIIAIDKANDSWQDYFKQLEKQGQGYIVDLIKNTDDLSKLTGEDLINANKKVRESAIAHNNALKQQTLGAKAATVATKALSVALNMVAFFAITEAISATVSWLDSYVNAAANAKESSEALTKKMKDFDSTVGENAKTLKSLNPQYQELSKHVNALGENISLSSS